ncbi:hypothetical protein BMT54_06285 [Pasteurellaceae bacterium 15-036681]|nr:hypothetical protein BMT54_06285 [Pasteurellaceae bacterium 15-036681]
MCDFILNEISAEYRAFFKIETNLAATSEVVHSIQAFSQAVDLLFARIQPEKVVSCIFGFRELNINFSGLELNYALIQPTLHFTLAHNIIFFDVINSIDKPFDVQVANYLEELIHAFMNTSDEIFTHQIVELVLPSVSYLDGCFQLR